MVLYLTQYLVWHNQGAEKPKHSDTFPQTVSQAREEMMRETDQMRLQVTSSFTFTTDHQSCKTPKLGSQTW